MHLRVVCGKFGERESDTERERDGEGEIESNQAVSKREDENKMGSRRDLSSSINLNKNTVEVMVVAKHLELRYQRNTGKRCERLPE